MDATANFSLRFARVSESKLETPDSFLSRQVLQRIATRLSLVSQAIGFSILGILIIMNRHQADLNGLAGGSAIAVIGGISAILVGTVSLLPLITIGGSAPDILLSCWSRARPPVSLSRDPTQ